MRRVPVEDHLVGALDRRDGVARTRQAERQRQLDQMVGDLLARAGAAGFTVEEVMERLNEFGRER